MKEFTVSAHDYKKYERVKSEEIFKVQRLPDLFVT